MTFPLVAMVLWAAGFVLNAILLSVLVYKRRYPTVPWFSGWIAFQCVYTVTLFVFFRVGSRHLYSVVYWSGAFIDLVFQVGVVLEIAGSVLRRSGRWVRGARARLFFLGASAPLVALFMAWSMHPAAESVLDAWAARGSLFTTILICLLFTGIVAASHQLGLGWHSYTMRESYGLIVWVLIAFLTDTLHAYWRTLGHFSLLENIRILVFQVVQLYWIRAFWLSEPVSQVISPEAMIYLGDLKKQLEFVQPHTLSPNDGVSPK